MRELHLSAVDVICNPSVLSTPNIGDVLGTSLFFRIKGGMNYATSIF